MRTAPVLSTAHGTRTEAFGALEWGLLGSVAAMWGSSFLMIVSALESLRPGLIAALRIALGAAALVMIPAARRRVAPEDRAVIVLLGVVWMAVPLTLFPIAQQWIASSVAGMINGAMPLFAGLIGALMLRRAPGRRQAVGLVLGFAGVALIMLPSATGGATTALGVVLLVGATILYGLAANLAVPLQQRYGALPVVVRAQLVALALTLPYGLVSVPGSRFSWTAAAAMAALGVLGTGLAFVAMANLVGRVGATRGAIAIYFVPVVATILGVVVRGESVAPPAVAGLALVLSGAYLTSRAERA